MKKQPTRKRKRIAKRHMSLESLEARQLLAVDGIRIDLSGTGSLDLFDPNGGGSVQEGYAKGPFGISIGTSNVPGQNNENPIAGDDTAAANEDGPIVTINVADLLLNDSDPDASGVLSIVAVNSSSSLGTAILDAGQGTITYDPNGAFETLAAGATTVDVFEYTLDDSANGRSTGRVSVTITGTNDAPVISGVSTVSVNEGSTASHTGSFSDVDSGDLVDLDESEGVVVDNHDGTWTWTLDTTDDATTRDVTITATDQHAATDVFVFQFTVNNVAPTIKLTGADSVDEAATYELTLGAVTDPGDETISEFEVNWGDGSPVETFVDNSAPLKTHVYADGPSEFTIIVSITDGDGQHVAATKSVTVNNVAPTASADQATVTVDEGATASATGTYGDVGDDTIALSASVGTVVDNNNGTWSWSLVTTDGPTQSQTVTITATDSDGAATPTTFDLVVNNVAPNVGADNATVTVDEGTTATNTGTYTDASGDTVTLSADAGTITDNDDGTWSWSYDTTDGPDENQTVTITATDQDGGQNSTTFDLVVNNVAPVAAPQAIDVLGNVPISRDWSTLLAGATDAGDDVLTVKSIDSLTGDGTLTFDNELKTFRYVPDTGFEGTTSFGFTIEDSDGATHSETATITIERSLWVVDNSAASGGNGSLASPFDSLTPLNEAEGSPDADAEGDIIFVVGTASPYNVTHGAHNDGGFHLESDQFLIGSGLPVALEAYLSSHGVEIPAGSDALPSTELPTTQLPGPILTNTTGDVVTTTGTSNVTIAGFAADPTASAGIAGENVSGLTIEFVIIITSGGGGDNEGIRLKTVTGTMTFNDVEIGSEEGQTNAGPAIQIDGGTATINFNDVDIDQDGGSLLEILNTAASTITFDSNSEMNLQGSDEAAVTITGNNGGTVTLNNAGFNANTTAAVKFNISGNTGLTTTTPVNDAPEFVLPGTPHLTLEDGGPQSIAAFVTGITPGPDPTESEQNVSFNILANDNEALFATLPQLDAEGKLSYTLADGALGTANITVSLSDDGGTADGGTDTSESKTFSIEVVPVNDAPSFTIAADPGTVPEDAGTQLVAGFASNLSAGPTDEAGQALTFEVTGNTNADLFAIAPAIDSAGDLTYTPADDVTGTATITVVLHDDGGVENGGVDTSSSQTFVITVSPPINDAPSFTLANPTVTVNEDAGSQSVSGFASSLSAGPADEATQTLTFEISGNSNAAMFATAPAIDASGNLTFTPADDAYGTATMTVVLRDSGGTENGGIETSVAQTITITVDPVNDAPVLAALDNPTVDELQAIAFTANATDVDNLDQTLTFSLDGNQPDGASITATGDFSWTPTEADGAGSFTFDVIVSDGELEDRQTITIAVNEVNAAPILDAIGNLIVDEGNAVSFTATATDADLPINTLTYSLAGNVPDGATITAAGVFDWTPSEAQGPGTFTFDIVVSDGELSDTQSVNIEVNDVPNAPVLATIANQSTSEGVELTFAASATDSDLPAQTLEFSLAGNVPEGASITEVGVFTWTPGETHGGSEFKMDVVVSDGVLTHSQEITITVDEVNDAPVLVTIGDRTVDEGSELTFTAAASDSDAPTQNLTFTLAGIVPAGASITEQGVFSWTPTEAQGPGTFTFDVQVSDGELTAKETITVSVNETNDAPVLDGIDNQTITEGSTLTFTATATDSDAPADTLTFSLSGDNVPAGASITEQGEFSWTPSETDSPGSFTFDIVVNDGTTTDSQSITIDVTEVNVAPVLAEISDKSIDEQSELTFTVTATDADLPENSLIFSLSGNVPSGATITEAGVFAWTPSEAQGPDSFTFDVIVSDGELSDTQSVNIEVNDVPNAPVLATIANQSTSEGVELTFTASATDSDLPAQALTFSLAGNVPDGASITEAGVFSWTTGESHGGSEFKFDVVVSDGELTHPQEITITVDEVNDAPVLVSIGDRTVDEGSELTFTAAASDSDAPTQNLTFTLAGIVPAGASITEQGVFSWTPTEAQGPGTFTFDVQVSDGELTAKETITVSVNETNDAPVLDGIDNQTITEGSTLTFTATATDSDAPADTLTFSLSGDNVPAGASITEQGEFSWTPSETDGPGSFTFDIVVSDGTTTDSQSVTIDVTEVNVAPVLAEISDKSIDEQSELTFTVTATDADLPENSLIFSLSGNAPSGATITEAGVFDWTPSEAQGPDSFTFDVIVSDGELSDTQSVNVEVNDVPNAPVLATIANQSTSEGVELTFTASATDTDLPAQTLTFSLAGNVPDGASITEAGVFSWTPGESHGGGEFKFDVVVSDGELTHPQEITITVDEVNDAPVLVTIGDRTVDEGSELTFTAAASDSDAPTQNLTFTLAGNVPAGASITEQGVFSWTPTEAQGPGTFTFDVQVSDGELTAKETISITVEEVNAAPVIGSVGSRSVTEGETLTFTATATDSDLPAQAITFSLGGTVPAGASITPAGVFTWTPASAQHGPHTIEIVATDNGAPANSDSETITVTVEAPVVLPSIADVRFEIGRFDVDGDLLFGSWIEVVGLGDSATDATRIDLQLAGDSEFTRFDSVGHYHDTGFHYDTLAEMLTAHDGVHTIGIDYDGDGDHEASFTIDVDLTGFTLDSFPALPTVTGPSGTIDDTTPTITWDAISGAESLYISVMQDNDDLDEVWYTEPELSGTATSVTAGTVPTGEALLAGVQANIRNDSLASASSTDGTVNLSFYSNTGVASPFTVDDGGSTDLNSADVEMELAKINSPGESAQFMFIVDFEVDDSRVNSATKLLFSAPDEPGNFQPLGGGPSSGWVDVEQESDETAQQFLTLFSDEWSFRVDFAGDGWDEAQGDEQVTIDVDVTGALDAFPDAPVITSPGAGEELAISGGQSTISWNAVNTSEVDFIIAGVDQVGGGELTDVDLANTATSVTFDAADPGSQVEAWIGAIDITEGNSYVSLVDGGSGVGFEFWLGNYSQDVFDVATSAVSIADVRFEIGRFDVDGDLLFGSWIEVVGLGDSATDATRIDLQLAGDGEFTRFDSVGHYHDTGFHYDTFAEMLAAHDGVHTVGIDYDGDGDHEATFTVDVDLTGFTLDSFPALPTVTGPSGTIDDTTPTITWDAISGAESLYISVMQDNDDLDEVWYTQTELSGSATSVTAGTVPTGEALLAGVQANIRNDSLASASSPDGTVNLSFYNNTGRASAFLVSTDDGGSTEDLLLDDDFTSGADGNGVPTGWDLAQTGVYQTSGSLVTFADITNDDTSPMLQSQTSLDPTGQRTTIVTKIDSVTAGDDAGFGVVTDLFTHGLAAGIYRSSADHAQIFVMAIHGSGEQIESLTETFAYSGGAVEITFEFDSDSFRVTADDFDSGEILFGDVFNDFAPSELGTSVHPILFSVSDEEVEPNETAPGIAAGAVVFDSIVVSTTAEPFDDYEVELTYIAATFEGQPRQLGELDVFITSDMVGQSTHVQMRLPGQETFVDMQQNGWGDAEADLLPVDGETNAEFFNRFVGLYHGDVDFQVDFEGDGTYDEQFTVSFDFDTLTIDAVPDAPQNFAPTEDSVIAAGTRSLTLTWDQVIDADGGFASVNVFESEPNEILQSSPFVEVDISPTQTSQTFDTLPTNTDLLAIVAASNNHSDLASAAGSVSVGFHHVTSSNFVIESEVVTVPAGDSDGSFAGGSNSIGGVEFGFEGVAGTAGFNSQYFAPTDYDAMAFLLGGEAALQATWQNFEITGENVIQLWDLSLTDAVGDVNFDGVELTFHYDESLLGIPWKSAADVENGLHIYHWSGSQWEQQHLIDRDTVNNTITIEADSFSPFVLGGPAIGAVVPADYASELVVGLGEYREGDAAAKQLAFIELGFNGADVPMNSSSQAFVKLPGASDYIKTDYWFNACDHDGNAGTPPINDAEFLLDIEQGALSLADFHNSIRGTWTVYVDIDGDSGAFPDEEDSDAKFTFVWDNSDLSNLPPAPTISSPSDNATGVDGGDGVTLAWDVATGSMAGIEVEAQVFSDADDIYHDDFAISGQTATTPSLPGGKTFEAEVIHVDDNRSFASNAQNASGFVSLDLGSTQSLVASWHNIEFTTGDEPFAEFELALERAYLPDGSVETFSFLDVSLTPDGRWTQNMELHIKQPGGAFEQQPTGWNSVGLDFDLADGQTLADFIDSLEGDYEVGVDYDGATDGNSNFDEHFTITVDLSGVDASSFPEVPTIVSPTGGATLPAGNRSTTIDWNPVADADFYFVGVDGVVDADVEAGTTEFTAHYLPTDVELLGFVGAAQEHDRTTLGFGDPLVDHVFFMTTYRGVNFSIDAELTDVPIGGSAGSHAGGSGTPGGLDYAFTGAHRDASLLADYFANDDYDFASELFGGESIVGAYYNQVEIVGDAFQTWDVQLFDDADVDVDFVHADLTLRYDQSLFGRDWSPLTSSQIEQNIYAYQFDAAANQWQPLQLLARDTAGDTITVRVNEMSPIVLGHNSGGAGVVPDDGQPLANVDFEVFHAVLGGETFFGANLDFRTDDPRTEQATTIKFKGPLDGDFQIITGGWGWETHSYDAADGQSLADFLDSLEGDYELHYDFAGDGTFEESLLFNLDTEGLNLSDFASAPTITSPSNGATLASSNRTPTVSWNAVPEADFMIVDFQAVEPDGIPVEPTIYETEVPATTTSVTSELLPTGVNFFVPVGAIVELDDVPVQRGGTDVVRVSFVLGHFTPLELSIERAETDVPAGDSAGTFGGGSGTLGGVDYALSGVASSGNFRAEFQPIAGNQEIMAMVYGSRESVQASFDIFYGTGEYQQGWRIGLTDANGTDIAATEMELTVKYDPTSFYEFLNESDVRIFQWNDATNQWTQPTIVSHNTTDHTITFVTSRVDSVVLGVPHAAHRAATAATGDVCHASITEEQLSSIVEEAIARLAATGISQQQIEQLRSTQISIADLEGNLLGITAGETITIDTNAANHGWFVDPTPSGDEEFKGETIADEAVDRIDLLTTVMHELGHILGAVDDHDQADELMSAVLQVGSRRLASDGIFSAADEDLIGLLASAQSHV